MKYTKIKYGHKQYYKTLIISSILLIVVFITSFLYGRYSVCFKDFVKVIMHLFCNNIEVDETSFRIILYIRLPRILLATLVGANLSISGLIFQSIFKNPMASPDILGCSNGAATGAAFAILFNFSKLGISFFAFITSLFTVFIVYIIGNKHTGNKIVNLILSGIIVSSIFSALTSYMKLAADPSNKLPEITYWLMGSFMGFKINELIYILPITIIVIIFIYLIRWKLNILSLSDDEAQTIGINVKLYRFIFIICATILTAISVAFSGCIGYVGLVIPHFSRKLVGNDNAYNIPISVIIGSLFLLIVDNISRNFTSIEIPIGILTAFIGAPFLLYLIYFKKGDDGCFV